MSEDNLRHAQYDAVGKQIDDPGEILRRFPGWMTEDNFIDVSTQSGAPVDTPKTIKFGAARSSSTGLLSVDAAGVFTVNKNGPIATKSRFRTGRSGASGVSHLFFWAEVSSDGGVIWTPIGNSVEIHLTDTTETHVFFDFSFLYVTSGLKLRQMFARSSTGDDSGDLIQSNPSAALLAYGVPDAPSAQTTVYRVNGYPYG